jgi:hypothetical protein
MSTKSFHDILRERGITQTSVAAALGLDKSTICRWQDVPSERLLEVEKITGISAFVLRPDLARIFVPTGDRTA